MHFPNICEVGWNGTLKVKLHSPFFWQVALKNKRVVSANGKQQLSKESRLIDTSIWMGKGGPFGAMSCLTFWRLSCEHPKGTMQDRNKSGTQSSTTSQKEAWDRRKVVWMWAMSQMSCRSVFGLVCLRCLRCLRVSESFKPLQTKGRAYRSRTVWPVDFIAWIYFLKLGLHFPQLAWPVGLIGSLTRTPASMHFSTPSTLIHQLDMMVIWKASEEHSEEPWLNSNFACSLTSSNQLAATKTHPYFSPPGQWIPKQWLVV